MKICTYVLNHTDTHVYVYIYIYIYVCVCVGVCFCVCIRKYVVHIQKFVNVSPPPYRRYKAQQAKTLRT